MMNLSFMTGLNIYIYRDLMKVDCTGCGYCMPCPQGVDIPQCFAFYNEKHMFKRSITSIFYLERLGGLMNRKSSYAGLCNGCERCAQACPQKLDVPLLLKMFHMIWGVVDSSISLKYLEG